MKNLRVGVDTGGTFTDFVIIRDGKIEIFKELSTPQKPEEAIMQGLTRQNQAAVREVIHGSTVATNALLERKGARTALLTTEGFDSLAGMGNLGMEYVPMPWHCPFPKDKIFARFLTLLRQKPREESIRPLPLGR